MGLLLQALDVVGRHRWRWLLVDERSGAALADHPVDLNPHATETKAFEDLYRYLRWRAEPDRRVASETRLVARIGAWIGSVALGEQVGRAIVAAAPVTVRVQIPAGAEFLAFRPWELAHVGGVPLAACGDVALVYDLPGPAGVAKAPMGDALRMLAVFSLPTATSALALRRERYGLSRRAAPGLAGRVMPADVLFETRPRKARRVAIAAAVVLVAVVAVLLRRTPTGVYFQLSDQVAMVLLGLLLAGAALLFARPRVRADADGVEVRNLGGSRTLPWRLVLRVSFPDCAPWARLELPEDEYIAVMAIQAADGRHAVQAIRALRALHAEHIAPGDVSDQDL